MAETWRLIVWSNSSWVWEQIDSITTDNYFDADEAAEKFLERNNLQEGETFLVSVDQKRLNLWEFTVQAVHNPQLESKRVFTKQ
jgi:hypothetical protein